MPGWRRSVAVAVALGGLATACGQAAEEAPNAAQVPTTTTTVAPSQSTAARLPLPPGWKRCEDRQRGYAVGYPGDWHALALASGPCHFFDPQPIEDPGNIDGFATWLVVFERDRPGRVLEDPDAGDTLTRRLLSSREVTFGTRQMLLIESEARIDVTLPAGTRFYSYSLDCGSGSVAVSTSSLPGRPETEYSAKKAVVDQAATTLECLLLAASE